MDVALDAPALGVFLPFCEREGITEVSAINARVLDRLSSWLLESGGRNGQAISPYSVHSYARAINHFLSWVKREGEPVEAKADLPKLPKRLVEVLSQTICSDRPTAPPTLGRARASRPGSSLPSP